MIADLADYNTPGAGGKGPNWHVTQSTIDHENYHWDTEWKTSFNAEWAKAEAKMEAVKIPCSAADTAAAALALLKPAADIEFTKGFTDAQTAYYRLGDAAGDPPYTAGMPALTAMIASIRAFAVTQRFPACP